VKISKAIFKSLSFTYQLKPEFELQLTKSRPIGLDLFEYWHPTQIKALFKNYRAKLSGINQIALQKTI